MSTVWTPPCEYIVSTKIRDEDTGTVKDHTFYCIRHHVDATASGAPCADNPLPPAGDDFWGDVPESEYGPF